MILAGSDIIKGIIYKLLSGNYYVDAGGNNYICRARGLFRLDNTTLLVGDKVEIEVDQFEVDKAYIVKRLERKNKLIRPPVANIEQSIVVMAAKKPNPNFYLLDKMILMSEIAGIKPIIVFNKADLVTTETIAEYKNHYKNTGYQVLAVSAETGENIDVLTKILDNSISAFSGPSGVGKSTLLNLFLPNAELKTGEISKKIDRGKHTTRHSELLKLTEDTYVLDTPGFTSLHVKGIELDELADYFPELLAHKDKCKYRDCAHINEIDCAVKTTLEKGEISNSRYRSYCMISDELRQRKNKY